MKTIPATLCAAVLALSLTSCSDSADDTTSSDPDRFQATYRHLAAASDIERQNEGTGAFTEENWPTNADEANDAFGFSDSTDMKFTVYDTPTSQEDFAYQVCLVDKNGTWAASTEEDGYAVTLMGDGTECSFEEEDAVVVAFGEEWTKGKDLMGSVPAGNI